MIKHNWSMDLFGDGIGKIEVVDYMGDDLSVVNAARVSFGGGADYAKIGVDGVGILASKDAKLIQYLAKNEHWSPFRHVQVQFAIKVPKFIAQQHWKHIVGTAYSGDGWNEKSMRYTEMKDELYTPQLVRGQSKSNKQCSSEVLEHSAEWTKLIAEANQASYTMYKRLIDGGVARETARGVLPLNTYTEYYWTTSLQAVCNFIKLRLASGAQGEIRDLASAVYSLIQPIFPVSIDALLGKVVANLE